MTTAMLGIPFTYVSRGRDIPYRFAVAHRRAWRRIAEPGDWWTGVERVAIAAETRAAAECPLCRERAAALSAASVQGEHLRPAGIVPGLLPEAAVDAIHAVIADGARLSPEWYERIISADGMDDARYVDMLGVVVHVFSVDEFHRALGMPLEPLPEPASGEPRRHRSSKAEHLSGWTPIVQPWMCNPEDRDIYPGMAWAANVLSALSLVPENVRWLAELSAAHYLPHHRVGSAMGVGADGWNRAISRPQVELIAARVSALNECFY